METKTCLRCRRLGRPSEHPLSEFYKDQTGKPLPTCRVCRRELSAAYHKRVVQEEKELPRTGRLTYAPAGILARTVFRQEIVGGPKIVVWRCASCYVRAITRAKGSEAPGLPSEWKSMTFKFGGKEESVIVCSKCFRILNNAQKILTRIAQRVQQEKDRATEYEHRDQPESRR